MTIKITGATKVPAKLPKTRMGGLADLYHKVRQERLELDRAAEAMKKEEQRIINHIIENTDLRTSTGIIGTAYKAIVVEEEVPVVNDWEKLYAHIKKKGEFDLLNRALNRAAVKARDGKKIPGVGAFHAKKLSVTKK